MKLSLSGIAACLAMCFCVSATAATPPQYAVIDLGVQQSPAPSSYLVPPRGSGEIFAANNFANVGLIGFSDGTHHAVMWRSVNGKLVPTDIGILPGAGGVGRPDFSAACSVNLTRQVVGLSESCATASSI